MKKIICTSCGASDLYQENGYWICPYCGTKYIDDDSNGNSATRKNSADNVHSTPVIKSSSKIGVSSDVEELLSKCKTDRRHAKKYINLILDLDPDNQEVYKYM